MLPSRYRLPLRAKPEFFQKAEKHYSSLFIVYFQKNDLEKARAAVVVSKKIEPKAVERNKVKRKLRAALLPVLPQVNGLDLMILAKKSTKQASQQELTKELEKAVLSVSQKVTQKNTQS